MADGVILKSGSYDPAGEEGREEKLESVLEDAGYEAVETETVPAGGEAATHVETQPRKSRKERAIERATAPLRAEIERLKAGQPQRATQAVAQPKPQRADFADDEAFEDALVAWGNQKFAAEKASQDAQAAQRQQDEQIIRNYSAQVERAKKVHPDWDQLKAKFDRDDVFIGDATQLAILEDQEHGAEITYFLMRNPDKARELGRMSQIKAVKEIDRLSARLAGNGARPRVPAPVRTVNTAGSSAAPTFAEIAARPNYPGKAKDLKRVER